MANNELSQFAKSQGWTKDEFVEEVMATAAGLGIMLLDEHNVKDKGVAWTIIDNAKNEKIRITICRVGV